MIFMEAKLKLISHLSLSSSHIMYAYLFQIYLIFSTFNHFLHFYSKDKHSPKLLF